MKGCRTLTDEEIRGILNELNPRDKVLMLTGLTFGTRISESLELTFEHVAGQFLSIRSKKGSENATFPIPESYRQAVEELKTWYEAKGYTVRPSMPLFLSQKGGSITRQQASQIIKAVCARLGIEGKVNSHSFRKNFVTRIYQLTGKDTAQTKVYSRHKNLANLDYYIQTTNQTSLVKDLTWT